MSTNAASKTGSPDAGHVGHADAQAASHGHADADSSNHGHTEAAGHGAESLGRPDFAMWGAGILGVLVALVIAACFAISVGGIGLA
jgi:hypothetical protein